MESNEQTELTNKNRLLESKTTAKGVEIGGGGTEQKGTRIMDMANSAVIAGAGGLSGLNGNRKKLQ